MLVPMSGASELSPFRNKSHDKETSFLPNAFFIQLFLPGCYGTSLCSDDIKSSKDVKSLLHKHLGFVLPIEKGRMKEWMNSKCQMSEIFAVAFIRRNTLRPGQLVHWLVAFFYSNRSIEKRILSIERVTLRNFEFINSFLFIIL